MRGILLAGDTGSLPSRAHPISHPLMPVFDKPMIYYPLATLMLAGLREVLVVAAPHDGPPLQRLLRDGSHLGMTIRHAVRPEPRGAAGALLDAADFVAGGPVALMLGATLLHGPAVGAALARHADVSGARVLAHRVRDPQEYDVVEVDGHGTVLSLEERPARPRGDHAVTGLSFYDATAVDTAARLRPRADGRLEAGDLNEAYRRRGSLRASLLGPGTAWLETTGFDALSAAGEFVRTVEVREGHKIGCIEEVAWRQGWIDDAGLATLAVAAGRTGYGRYLRMLAGGYADAVIELPALRRAAGRAIHAG